jgi:hypothetical protein
VSTHKCRHCGEDIRSVRLWLPRPPDWPGGILTPPPFDTAYEALEDGGRFCRGVDTWTWNLTGAEQTEVQLPHQPMPRIRT